MKPVQIYQTQLFEMLIKASHFRRPKGPLTAPAQMLDHPAAHIPGHHAFCLARVAVGKVIGPPSQLPIDTFDQMRHRHMTLPTIDHLAERIPLRLQRLRRRSYIQVPEPTTFKIPVVSEYETQKDHTGSELPKINDLRLVPVQFQTQPGLNLRFDKIAHPATRIPSQHHKVVRIAYDLSLGPDTGTFDGVENLLKPVKVHIRQKRRNYSPYAKGNLAL